MQTNKDKLSSLSTTTKTNVRQEKTCIKDKTQVITKQRVIELTRTPKTK